MVTRLLDLVSALDVGQQVVPTSRLVRGLTLEVGLNSKSHLHQGCLLGLQVLRTGWTLLPSDWVDVRL